MNNKIAFGQYYHTNSVIHRMDPRIKIIITLLFMVGIFLVPTNNFIILGILFLLTLGMILLTKVPLLRYLKSLKQIIFLMCFTFFFQVIFANSGNVIYTINHHLTIINLLVSILIIVVYIFIKKYLPFRILFLLVVIALVFWVLQYPIYGFEITNYSINIYDQGLVNGSFIVARVLLLIIFSTILTLTTKPTLLNIGLESLLSPLEKLKIKTNIFAMMISIALRFIPTLFLEADKILKAQASRGLDFNEGKFMNKVTQIVSLLVPMFIVSFKRADDLAIAMEARGYIPGEKRTKITELKLRFIDVMWLLLYILVFISLILVRVL